jgi:hypothetical protein
MRRFREGGEIKIKMRMITDMEYGISDIGKD